MIPPWWETKSEFICRTYITFHLRHFSWGHSKLYLTWHPKCNGIKALLQSQTLSNSTSVGLTSSVLTHRFDFVYQSPFKVIFLAYAHNHVTLLCASVLWKWFSCGTLARDMFWGFWQNINSMVRDGMSKLYIKSTLTKCLLLTSYFRNVIVLWDVKYVVYSILEFPNLVMWPGQLLILKNHELTESFSIMTGQIIMLVLHSLEFKPQCSL